MMSSALQFKDQNNKPTLKEFLTRNPFPHPFTLGFFYREKMRAIHRVAPNLDFDKILEIGGGQGGLTALVYPNSHITNIDFNPDFAGASCNQQKNVNFVCGDAVALPFADNSFAVVTLFDVLEHILDDKKAISEALRVLKTGGFLMVSTPNENWKFPYYNALRGICPKETEVMNEWGHVRRGYTLDELNRLVGIPCQKYATFINPLTVLCHDVAFSQLPVHVRRLICTLISPLTWISYYRHSPQTKGTETAYVWQKN
jgi:SAM-dependent methyltransferase